MDDVLQVDFLLESYQKYGPVYSFTMFGTNVTYLRKSCHVGCRIYACVRVLGFGNVRGWMCGRACHGCRCLCANGGRERHLSWVDLTNHWADINMGVHLCAVGSEASALFWTSHNDDLNAEDLYKNITVPVFGKGVAFDVSNKVRC